MLNRGKLNRQPLNWARLPTIHITVRYIEKMTGFSGIGATHYLELRFNDSLSGRAMMSKGIYIQKAFEESAIGSANASQGVYAAHPFTENMAGSSWAGANIFAVAGLAENAVGAGYLGAELNLYDTLSEAFSATSWMGANISITKELYETLNGFASAENIVEYILKLRDPIPAGGVLIIDSEEFNVLLNQKNIIAQHSGDWIRVGRGTKTITVSNVGGNSFSMEVFYIAKYL